MNGHKCYIGSLYWACTTLLYMSLIVSHSLAHISISLVNGQYERKLKIISFFYHVTGLLYLAPYKNMELSSLVTFTIKKGK